MFDEQDKVYEVRLIDKPNYNIILQKSSINIRSIQERIQGNYGHNYLKWLYSRWNFQQKIVLTRLSNLIKFMVMTSRHLF